MSSFLFVFSNSSIISWSQDKLQDTLKSQEDILATPRLPDDKFQQDRAGAAAGNCRAIKKELMARKYVPDLLLLSALVKKEGYSELDLDMRVIIAKYHTTQKPVELVYDNYTFFPKEEMSDAMVYRESVENTINKSVDPSKYDMMGALGLCGEAGEVADIIKKDHFQGAVPDRDRFLKELGDVRWYMEVLCIAFNTTMEEVERLNMEKLQARYPNGFSVEASNVRKEGE